MRSGNSGISERDVLHAVLTIHADGQMNMRAEEDTFLNLPTASTSHPYMHDEHPAAWTFENYHIAEEEARGYMNVFTSLSRNDWVLEQRRRKGLLGTTVSEVPGILGERHELALAAYSGTMINGRLIILSDIGSNLDIIGLKTTQNSQQVSHSYGHAIKRLSLTKRLYVSGVGHGAAICDKSLHCNIACKERGDSAGQPAVPRLDTYSANVAKGSGENLHAIMGLRSMSNMRAILILEQGTREDDHPWSGDVQGSVRKGCQGTRPDEDAPRASGTQS
eukprot:6269929-Pyramimonas_sp.AAC.1